MSSDYSAFREFTKMLEEAFKPYTVKEVLDYALGKIRAAEKRNSFFDMLISGGQGMGKSTLALYILYKYYGDPQEVLRNVFFKIDDLNETLLNEKRRAVLLDDAGITLSKYRALDDAAVDYYALQQIGRTRVSAILYTTVFDNVAKFIRDIVDVVVALHSRKGDVVYGILYRKKQKYMTVVYKKFEFEMNLEEIHNNKEFHDLYVEYNKRREEFVREVVRQLLERKKKRAIKEGAETIVELAKAYKPPPETETEIDKRLKELMGQE